MSKPQQERNVLVPDDLIHDLLTVSEVRMVKQRLAIMKLIHQGLSVRQISSQMEVGTDTVVRIARMMESKPAFKKYFASSSLKSSKWVFGQAQMEEK